MKELCFSLEILQSWKASRLTSMFMNNYLVFHKYANQDEMLKELCYKFSKLEFEKVMDIYQIIEETVKTNSKSGYYEESEYTNMLEFFKENVLDKKELPFSIN